LADERQVFAAVEALRRDLESSTEPIAVENFGAGTKSAGTAATPNVSTVGEMTARTSGSPTSAAHPPR
jgi:hypothetical protein